MIIGIHSDGFWPIFNALFLFSFQSLMGFVLCMRDLYVQCSLACYHYGSTVQLAKPIYMYDHTSCINDVDLPSGNASQIPACHRYVFSM